MSEENRRPQGEGPNNRGRNPFQFVLNFVMYIVGFIALFFVKPAQYFTKEVYERSSLAGFAHVLGILASAAGSIGTGYYLGFVLNAELTTWLLSALAAIAAVYFYVWPILWLLAFKWTFKVSEWLWGFVGERERNHYHPVWFSYLLTTLSIIAAVIVSGFLGSSIGHSIYDWANPGAGLFSLIVAAVSFVIALIAFGIVAWISCMIIWEGGMIVLAALAGITTAWQATSTIELLASAHSLPHFSVYVAQTAIAFAIAGYVFPLIHIFVSHFFNFFGRHLRRLIHWILDIWGDFLVSVYDDSDHRFVRFLQHLAGLALAALGGLYAHGHTQELSLIPTVFGVSAASIASYILGGYLAQKTHSLTLSFIIAGTAFVSALVNPELLPFQGEWWLHALEGLAQALFILFFAFPVAYQVFKFFTNFLLASWLTKPLDRLYLVVSEELWEAYTMTYEDVNEGARNYSLLFTHLINVTVAVLAALALHKVVIFTNLPTPWLVALPIIGTIFSYLFVGKLFLAWKNHLHGSLSALALGAYTGVEVFALKGSLWWAIPAFGLATWLTYGLIFPVIYVFWRAVFAAINAEYWLLVPMDAVYRFAFGLVSNIWSQFMQIYRQLEASFRPIWRKLSQAWDEAWEEAKASFNKVFNRFDD
jgi:hypothetical protein